MALKHPWDCCLAKGDFFSIDFTRPSFANVFFPNHFFFGVVEFPTNTSFLRWSNLSERIVLGNTGWKCCDMADMMWLGVVKCWECGGA